MDKETVLITGITGYVGSAVCKAFLEDGTYKVRGTVRDTKRADKIDPLKEAFGELFNQLELVEADLNEEETMIKACEGCQYAVHTASPFTMQNPENPDDMIKPAINGTLSILKGATQHSLKRVVFTSSTLCIMWNDPDRKITDYDENIWSDLEWMNTYGKSKLLAEQAAWKYHEDNGKTFELTAVLPGLVIGPNLNKCQFESGDMVKKMLLGKSPLAGLCIPFVDVRDVAKAHLEALKRPEAANQRYMNVAQGFMFADMAGWLKEKYAPAYEVRTDLFPECKPDCVGCSSGNKEHKRLWANWNIPKTFHNEKTKTELGIEYRDIKTCVLEMVERLIATGYDGLTDQMK